VIVCQSGEELVAEWYRDDKRYFAMDVCKLLNWAFARGWRARMHPQQEQAEFCVMEPDRATSP
jgi:hypothetical protein